MTHDELIGGSLLVLMIGLILGRMIVARTARRIASSDRVAQKGGTRLKLVAFPLLLEWQTFDHSKEIESGLVFLRGGDVVISNQLYKRWDEVDYTFPGGHAYRRVGEDRLFVRSAGTGEIYMFEYRHIHSRGFGWFRLIHRRTS